MQERIARTAARLLAADPDWQEQADEIERVLEASNIPVSEEKTTPGMWARMVFEENSVTIPLAKKAIELHLNPERYKSLRGLVDNLLV